MNYFLDNPIPTAAQAMRGFANGGEVESITGEDNFLRTLPAVQIGELADRYGIMPTGEEEKLTEPQESSSMDFEAGQKMMALMSLIDPSALSAMNFQVGDAAFGGGAPSTFRADTRAGLGSAGSFYEEGALEAFKKAAKDPTQGIFKSGFDALAGEPGIAEAIAAKSERDVGALAKVESEYSVMKPLSDMLKANQFKEAFDFAKQNNVVDKLMDTKTLQELRPAFNQQEMRDFFAAVPKDYAGGKFDFKPDIGVLESMDPYGQGTLMESGYPDPTRAFKRKDDKTVENLAKVAAVAMFAAGLAPVFAGAGAGAGAGAAGSTAAGAASTGGGFLTGLKTAATNVLSIPQTIGKTVAAQLGVGSVSPVTAKMIGNAIISGGVTGAKGGDLGDILKSAAMAAGLTFVSDKVISSVAQKLQDSRLMDAVKDIPGGDVSAVSPTAAANIANSVSQGLEEFAVTTFAPSAAAAGLANVGALAGAQAAVSPDQPAPEQVGPEDEIAGEFTVETTAPDFGAGLETGAYTGYKLASDQGVEEPAVTEQTEVVEEPVEEIKVSTEADQLDFSDPFIQSLIDQYTPEVTQPDLEEVKVSTSPDELEVSDASDAVIQTVMDQFEPAPIDPETGMAEIEVSTDNLDLTDPLTQVLVNRFDVETPEPVTDDIEEFKVETERELPDEDLDIPPTTPIVVDPADILKDYKPVGVEEDPFKELLKKYGTLENLIKGLGVLGGTSKTTPPPAVAAPYDPRASAGAGQWIDWEKVKAEADAAGMNLNTYTARNWNRIQNRALEAGVPQPVAPVVPTAPEYNPDLDIMSALERYQPDLQMNRGGLGRYVDGPGSGRDDKIPALLSDGEYVIDAETLALLGDGSTKEGARKMDEFRSSIRKHKGSKLAKGGISPNAKSPLQYLRGV